MNTKKIVLFATKPPSRHPDAATNAEERNIPMNVTGPLASSRPLRAASAAAACAKESIKR
jgi:hypothetical protein